MTIVCGTDFSEMAGHGGTVAASLSARLQKPLHLLHVLDMAPGELQETPAHPLLLWAESRLAREAERLRALGAEVSVEVAAGVTHEVMGAAVSRLGASLIVIGATGVGSRLLRGFGTRADGVAQHSRVPVVTVRDAAPFVAWLENRQPLRVVLGIDASSSAENAARWLDELCRLGPCEVVLAHLYWPPEAYHRLGLGGLRSFVDPDTEIVSTLEQQFSQRFDALLHAKTRRYQIEPHLGRVGDGLAALATEASADLLVVGTHDQSMLSRLWEGSIGRQALRAAASNVACVPTPAADEVRPQHTPRLRHVLVATDFSELGNCAIPLAYAAASPGGTVHLTHVVKGARTRFDLYDIMHPVPDATLSEAANGAGARLSELVPVDASNKSVSTQVHVLEAPEAALAICQAAERVGADLICLGTHGRSGIAKTVLGSVASGVLSGTRRPVLLARGSRP